MENTKYSFLMPYYDRAKQFKNTINCFKHFYSDRDDWEIILVEDLKNTEDEKKHSDLLEIIEYAKDFNITHLNYERADCYNPAEMFNIAAKNAKGDFLIITNPEMLHESNLLSGFDKKLLEKPEDYIVCCCKAVDDVNDFSEYKDLRYNMKKWYAHPTHRNCLLHFCSVMSKDIFRRIGGFDEGFIRGIAFEDTDFVRKVRWGEIKIHLCRDMVVLHQDHSREYLLSESQRDKLRRVNEVYFGQKRRRNFSLKK